MATIDCESGLEIRKTDNGMHEGDLKADQTPEPLALGDDGMPEGWEAPNGDC